jgi:hypothetical protein
MANQAFFTRIYLDADDQITTEPTPSYRLLLDPNVQRQALTWASLHENGKKRPTRTPASQDEGSSKTHQVELGGIEPPSAERLPTALRPFPRSTALRLPHRRVGGPRGGGRRRVFPRCQRSFPPPAVFPAVNHRFCCRAAVLRPRVPLLVAGALGRLGYQAATANCLLAVVVVPRLRSLSNSGRTIRLPVSTSKPISPLSSSPTSLPATRVPPDAVPLGFARPHPPLARWHPMGDAADWGARGAAVVLRGFTQMACDLDNDRLSSALGALTTAEPGGGRPA